MRVVVGLMLVAMLASSSGCLGGEADPTSRPAAGPEQAAFDVEVRATPTTGVIRGVVVDRAIRPVANVAVSLEGTRVNATATNAAGAFGFQGLEPGGYQLVASKGGYLTSRVAVQVVAGENEPRAVKVELALDSSYAPPYQEAQKADGYILCTTSKLAPCQATNGICPPAVGCLHATDDHSVFHLFVDAGPTFVQSEWIWEATSDANRLIKFQMASDLDPKKAGCDGKWFNQTEALPSPTHATVEGDLLGNLTPGSSMCTVAYSLQSGPFIDGTCLDPSDGNGFLCPGVTVQQSFSVFLHSFYGYRPPAGWRFTTDGEAAPPS